MFTQEQQSKTKHIKPVLITKEVASKWQFIFKDYWNKLGM